MNGDEWGSHEFWNRDKVEIILGNVIKKGKALEVM